MNIIPWKQSDGRWGGQLLGYNTGADFNLTNYGCLVSSVASLLATVTQDQSMTPGWLNAYLKANNGFQANGGLMVWSAVTRLFPYLEDRGTTTDLNRLKDWLLDTPNFAILKVNNGAHWVLAVNQKQIMDPATGTLRPLNTYPIAQARFYRFEAGRGEGAVMTPTPGMNVSSDRTMTADEERLAYQIVLNREPDIQLPGGRTAFAFIRDAKPELDIQRKHTAEQVAATLLENEGLKAHIRELEAQAGAMREELATNVLKPDWQSTLELNRQVRQAIRAGVAVDLLGEKPDYPVSVGMVVRQAGTFLKDGAIYVLTEKSHENGDWYGFPLELFEDVPDIELSADSTVDKAHLTLAYVYGWLKRLEHRVFSRIKKKG